MSHDDSPPINLPAPISVSDHGVMRVEGELDVGTAKDFFATLVELIHTPGSTVRLDLSGVTFFDSHAVSALIRARRLAEVRQVRLLVDPSPLVLRILGRIGLIDQFHWQSFAETGPDGVVVTSDQARSPRAE